MKSILLALLLCGCATYPPDNVGLQLELEAAAEEVRTPNPRVLEYVIH